MSSSFPRHFCIIQFNIDIFLDLIHFVLDFSSLLMICSFGELIQFKQLRTLYYHRNIKISMSFNDKQIAFSSTTLET